MTEVAITNRITPLARGLAMAMATVSVLLLGACSASVSTTKQLNTGEAQDTIRESLQGETDLPVGDVDCPDREVKQGDVFDCTAQIDGQPLRFQVTQDDDQGHVSIEQMQAVIVLDDAVAFVEEEVIGPDGDAVEADCGPGRILVKDPGSTFECEVSPTGGGADSRVIMTVDDTDGNVTLSLP